MERKLLLLGLLRKGELHGYQLNELISGQLGAGVLLKKATAYRLLHQMADDGWIDYREEQEGNRPTRRVYKITSKGEENFQRLLRESLASYQSAGHPNAISIAFLDALPPDEVISLLELRCKEIGTALQAVNQIDQAEDSFQLIIENRILHLAAELAWLNEIISLIASPMWKK